MAKQTEPRLIWRNGKKVRRDPGFGYRYWQGSYAYLWVHRQRARYVGRGTIQGGSQTERWDQHRRPDPMAVKRGAAKSEWKRTLATMPDYMRWGKTNYFLKHVH